MYKPILNSKSKQMNQIKHSFLLSLIILIVGVYSCTPPINSKETYLKEYKTFVDEVKANKDNYSEEDWKKKDEEFKRFSEELYQKFDDELSFSEQIKVGKFALVYGSTKGVNSLSRALNSGEIEDAVEEITNIFDDELVDGLDNVIQDLKKAWDEDMKDDLKEKLEELREKLQDEDFREDLSKQMEEIKKIVNDEDVQEKLKDVSVELKELIEEIEKKSN